MRTDELAPIRELPSAAAGPANQPQHVRTRLAIRLGCGHNHQHVSAEAPLLTATMDCPTCGPAQSVTGVTWDRTTSPLPPRQVLKKGFAIARELGLTREDRLEFASMVTNRDITSWNDLTPQEAGRVIDALTGHQLVNELHAQRQTREEGGS